MFCRTKCQGNKEYIVWLKEQSDFKEAGSGAMFCLGSHYYHGTLRVPVDIAKGMQLWTASASMSNKGEACLNLALHYSGVVKDFKKARYYFEKGAILGNVKS